MKVQVNSIRAGNVIEYNGKLWVAAKVQHISPGKGGAFVAIEAKALREGNKLQERFRSGETIERVHIDERECTYLFKDENGFTFMDKENFSSLWSAPMSSTTTSRAGCRTAWKTGTRRRPASCWCGRCADRTGERAGRPGRS